MRLSSRGYFGIGTSPTEELHVQGDAINRCYYDMNNSSGTAGQILSSTATGTEWIPAPSGSGSDDDWILNSANNSIWNNHPTYSKVGIGPFFSNANPPQSRLHIDGRLLVTGGGNQWSKVEVDFNTGGYTFFEMRDGNSTSDFRFSTGGNNGSIEHSFINGNGNLGIGLTNPTQKLHVSGNMRLTGAYYDMNNSPGTAGQILSSTVNGTEWIPAPSGSGSDTDWTEDVNSVYNSTKNIGVGTSTPTSKLHVLSSQNIASTPSMIVENSNNDEDADATIHFKNSHSTALANFTIGVNSSLGGAFEIRNSQGLTSAGDPVLHVDPSSGFVGIGTTTLFHNLRFGVILMFGLEIFLLLAEQLLLL